MNYTISMTVDDCLKELLENSGCFLLFKATLFLYFVKQVTTFTEHSDQMKMLFVFKIFVQS